MPASELLSSAGSGVFDVSAGSSHMLASIAEECLDKFPEDVEPLGELKPRLDSLTKTERCKLQSECFHLLATISFLVPRDS
jgi:hypothetical protein